MNLLGIGVPEAGLIFVLALIFVGPQRFPEMARQAGRWYRTARAFSDGVMKDVRAAVDELEGELDAETEGGLQPIRELTGIRRDLIDAIEATAERQGLGRTAGAAAADPLALAAPPAPAVEATVEAAAPSPAEPEASGANGHTSA